MQEDRLTDIEIRIEYQDRTIHALNDVVVAQQSQIEKLEANIEKLRQIIQNETPSFGPANEKPPHY